MTALARLIYALAIGACLIVGGVAAAFVLVQLGPAHLAWWSCGLVPAGFALAALVACFTPYDAPASTPRWAGVPFGAALGGAAVGLVCFPTSFFVLSPLSVAYALGLRWSALRLSRELVDDPETPLTRMRVPATVAALLAAMSLVSMRPAGEGPRPLAPPDADVAPILSSPTVTLDRRRVQRHPGHLQSSGRRVRSMLSLGRPRVQVELRKQVLLVDPCLRVVRGAVDGFLLAKNLNGYGLELRGLAKADHVEGWARGWMRADYLHASVPRGSVPDLFGTAPAPPQLTGSIVVVTELEAGWVAIEATTRVHSPLAVNRLVACRIELKNPKSGRLRLGLGAGAEWELSEPDEQALIVDADSARLVRLASRGRVASAIGDDLEWILLDGPRDPILVLSPDWRSTVAHDRVRAGPHELLANSLTARLGTNFLSLEFDPGSSRHSAAPLSSWLRPGLYRTRLAFRALNAEEGPRNAAQELVKQLGW